MLKSLPLKKRVFRKSLKPSALASQSQIHRPDKYKCGMKIKCKKHWNLCTRGGVSGEVLRNTVSHKQRLVINWLCEAWCYEWPAKIPEYR